MATLNRLVKAQQCIVAVLFSFSAVANAGNQLDVGLGFGSDDNIFFANTGEKEESFGVLDVNYEFDADLSDNVELEVDAVYEDRYFSGGPEARDKFVSGFTQLVYKAKNHEFGLQVDPQYRQFVTSDTDGVLIVGDKQRIETLKARAFSAFDLSRTQSFEAGYERKIKDYKDSDSDYDADVWDVRYRSRITDGIRLTIGGEIEQRDYDDRLAVDAQGNSQADQKLEINRTTLLVRGSWRPAANQKYSLEYKYRENDDDFEDYFGHQRHQLSLRTDYEWSSGIALETKLKFSDKSYDEQLDDDGGSLDREKTSLDLELIVPFDALLEGGQSDWYARLVYEWDDSDSGEAQRSYNKNVYWFAVHKVFN